MFAKPFKIKSFTTLKNTEKKSLAQRIAETFPSADEQKVKELVHVKSTTHCLKLVLHSQQLVEVYVVNNVPMMIDTEQGLVPTVCALWKVPELLPTIYIHAPVLPKILGGAPLYLPGVEIPPQGVGFPMFAKGALLAACTTDNQAAGVVGRAAMGSGDMLLRAAGVCLETINVYGDQLCREAKFDKIERPQLGAMPLHHTSTEQITESISELTIKPANEAWPSLPQHKSAPSLPAPAAVPPAPAPNQPKIIPEKEEGDNLNDSMLSGPLEPDETEIPGDMDGLLRWCLLSFLRLEGKHVELPLKTNLLYKNHLYPLCPADRTLDVKKSSYKKMSKFLEAMQREGLLEVKEIDKGVDAVVSVNLVHPLVRAQKVPAQIKEQLAKAREPRGDSEVDYIPPEVREMLCVTAAVADLFKHVRKGTALTASEVRSALTEYVKTRNLNSTEQKGAVTLDATLAKIVGKAEQDTVKWDALMSGVQARMTSATEVRWAEGGTKLIKAKLDPISMQVATRSGNKKVTLVSNLEAYGFSLAALSHTCQLGVGASCGVTRSPGAKCDQLLLQGDQTHFVARLLVEKYGLPKKFVEGADKALKKRK